MLPVAPVTGVTTRINIYTGERQLLTRDLLALLALLADQRPAGARCVIGITMDDLYPDPAWNFCSGRPPHASAPACTASPGICVLCPVDLRKLQHSIGFDAADRYRRLRTFAGDAGFTDEARWLTTQLLHIEQDPATPDLARPHPPADSTCR